MRKRNYQSAGLIDNLICTISINKSRRIKEIDIIGGTPEQFGIYRIVWNKAWLQKVKTQKHLSDKIAIFYKTCLTWVLSQ